MYRLHFRLKQVLIACTVMLSAYVTQGAPYAWTWMKGSNQVCSDGNYGTIQVPSPENDPSSRASSASWTDSEGNLWLFGGFRGYGKSPDGFLSDLWKYETSTKNWTWISGPSDLDATGVYGIQGESSTATFPGARAASTTWTDADGNFWLFGGYYVTQDPTRTAYQYHSDLWKYDRTAAQWTWVNGSDETNQNGIYGIPGQEALENCPGARSHAVSWVDSKGNFWLFGGNGFSASSTQNGFLNDLWKFNPVTGSWTWISGSNSTSESAQYGTQGVPDASNIPGARRGMVGWIDSEDNLWVFGGYGLTSERVLGLFNDLWKYNPSADTWTWVKGSNVPYDYGNYGTKRVEAGTNTPGAREHATVWKDADGNFWLFGGYGRGATTAVLNDLWRLDKDTLRWTWWEGEREGNRRPDFYIFQFTYAGYGPGSKQRGTSWTDKKGNLWLFGGHTNFGSDSNSFGDTNDLWVYNLANDPALLNPVSWSLGRNTVQHQPVRTAPTIDFWLTETSSSLSYTITDDAPWLDISPSQGTLTSSATTHHLDMDVGLPPATYSAKIVVECPGSLNRYTTVSTYLTITSASLTRSPASLSPTASLGTSAPTDEITIRATGTSSSLSYTVESNVAWAQVISNAGYVTTEPKALAVVYDTANLSSGTYTGKLMLSSPDSHNKETAVDLTLTIGTEKFGVWTWVKGTAEGNAVAVRSEPGVEDINNTPGALESATSWHTSDGNLWLFGGKKAYPTQFRNDLWKYKASTNSWTWEKGSSLGDQIGVYGEIGVSDPGNNPGGRYEALSWLDSEDNLWLYGGAGYGSTSPAGWLSDLWKFNTNTYNWSWESGTTLTFENPRYNELGEASTTATPGARNGSATWTDDDGHLWLFGGVYNITSYNNDLWKYNTAVRNWVWVAGSNVRNQPGIYGTKGISSPVNYPSSRTNGAVCKDYDGNIWLFGGLGYGETTTTLGLLNDLWKHDVHNKTWTWMSGNKVPAKYNEIAVGGVYGTLGIPGPNNQPGERQGAATWVDSDGKLWLFGGIVSRSLDFREEDVCNDIWMYDPLLSQWTWMKGSPYTNPVGIYGRMGFPSGGNTPGGRGVTVNWHDHEGHFCLYGGIGITYFLGDPVYTKPLNDLWKFSLPQGSSSVEWSDLLLY